MFPRVTHPSATNPEGSVRLACVRPAASVHSEPGSNSQVESTEVLSLTSNLRTSAMSVTDIVFIHAPSYRSNVTHKREALNSIIGPSSHDNFPKSPDMLRLRRRCAQTARISLQILSMSKSDLPTKFSTGAKLLALRRRPYLQIFRTFTTACASLQSVTVAVSLR